MEFDPIKDYYGLDISSPNNRVLWTFWECIKTLVTLSSSAKRQQEIMGYVITEDMASDFETYYTFESKCYLKHELLNLDQKKNLDKIDSFLDDRSGDKMPDFWNDDLLESHIDWFRIRLMAKSTLNELGYGNLEIELKRITENVIPDGENTLSTEWTKILLRKIKTGQND